MLTPKTPILENSYDYSSIQKQAIDILHNFNFNAVATVMATPCKPVYNNDYTKVYGYEPWTIYTRRGLAVPTAEELYSVARKMLKECVTWITNHPNEQYYMAATGPLEVEYNKPVVTLKAIIESWGGLF